jgi:glycosyltransferase involved in cell wall biosynthesis
MNISIFAKPPSFWGGHMHGVSAIIRGEQMAAYMQNARLNPVSGYENDVCIYVKPHVRPDQDFKFEGHPYLDILDGFDLIHLLRKHEDVPVIVYSDLDVQTMPQYVNNKIVLIPHHHINFEKFKRERSKVTRVGIIGSPGAFPFVPNEIREGLAKRKMELVENFVMYPRMSVVKFYLNIDIQIVWRPYMSRYYSSTPYRFLANPFKIVNTSAFGIPTIALDEPPFKEMEGCYIPVHNVEEFFKALDNLRFDLGLYQNISQKCLEKAERYHIENIAKLYQKLT